MARHAVTGYDLEAHAVPAASVEIISHWSTARLQRRARSENGRPYGSPRAKVVSLVAGMRPEQVRAISWEENAGLGTSKLRDRARAKRIEIEGGDQKAAAWAGFRACQGCSAHSCMSGSWTQVNHVSSYLEVRIITIC